MLPEFSRHRRIKPICQVWQPAANPIVRRKKLLLSAALVAVFTDAAHRPNAGLTTVPIRPAPDNIESCNSPAHT
jgi:hypothetical protein